MFKRLCVFAVIALSGAGPALAAPVVTLTAPASHVRYVPPAATVFYIQTDQLNTPRLITDANNNVVWKWDSEPFGGTLPDQAPNGAGSEFTFNLRFPGQYFDQETHLHYNYFRDYDPATGRYVESDPIGLSAGANTYAYVRGNPLRRIDPFGLRDVIVVVWTSQIAHESVGHVFVGEMNGYPITSQFPYPHAMEGENTTKSWIDTVAAEGRQPDHVYQVTVPNDAAFDAAAKARRTPRWYAFPDGEASTNCTRAAADAMHAGGVGGVSSTGSAWPNWFNSDLQFASWFGSQVYPLPAAPW